LKKYFYGLEQTPKAWYARIDSYLMSLGFTKSDADSNMYHKVEDGYPLILVLYVDEMFLTRDEMLIDGCKRDFGFRDFGSFVVDFLDPLIPRTLKC
jgi:hypothetical protein